MQQQKEITFAVFACLALAYSVSGVSEDIDVNLLRTNPGGQTSRGTVFLVSFFENIEPQLDPDSDLLIHINTADPNGAVVMISAPLYDGTDFNPRTITIETGTTATVSDIPDSFRVSIRNNNNDRAIKVESLNGAEISVTGINDVTVSADGFLGLPCKEYKSDVSATSEYNYFVFSTLRQATTDTRVQGTFLITACEENTGTIDIEIPGATTPTQVFNLRQYQSHVYERAEDITGIIIKSAKPLAVFVGHNCGDVPSTAGTCDLLVEQVPPHATYGQTFFIAPFALRRAGNFFRIGSVANDNEITVTCTNRNIPADQPDITVRTINRGRFYEHRTPDIFSTPVSLIDYRRDFCCIQSSKPATVMQYMMGHSVDDVTGVRGISGDVGDPAITYVPPAEQYSNNYIVKTLDDVITNTIYHEFLSFISWVIPAQFFDPDTDQSNFMVNNKSFSVPSVDNSANTGSGGYIPIPCKNGEICAYGAYAPLAVTNATAISYTSAMEPRAGIYVHVYGYEAEYSYAYPAGYECEPIGLPHISVFDVTVTEGEGIIASVIFNRTGGDLGFRSRIHASTVQVVAGGAVEGADYLPITNRRIVFLEGSTTPRTGNRDIPFDITIVNDDVAEPTEYLEVHFINNQTVGVGYAYPSAIARVTILDDDTGGSCALVPDSYTVTEGLDSTVEVTVQTTDPTTQACVLTTSDITATGGLDYQTLTSQVVDFAGATETTVSIAIMDDVLAEDTETFRVTLTSTSSTVTVPSGMSTADVQVLDTDVVRVSFVPTLVEVQENVTSGTTEVCLRGDVASTQPYTVVVTHQPSGDNPATAGDDYTVDMADLSVVFPSGEPTTQCIPVRIVDDSISLEERETFMFTITSTTDGAVPGDDPEATVAIIDNDKLEVSLPGPITSPENPSDMHNFCIDKPLTGQDFIFKIEILNVEDGVDIAETEFELVIPGDEVTGCVEFDIIDNKIALEGDRTYPIRITVIEPAGSGITIPASTLTITENDMLEVYFEEENYPVSESVGQVETCLLLNCEAAEPVTVTLSAQENIPADAQDVEDFSAMTTSVTFEPGETRVCAKFDIVNDTIVETPIEEKFTVEIIQVSQPVNITRQPRTTVTITDDDTFSVRIAEEDYIVNENEGTVTICVEKLGQTAEDITVTIRSMERSPVSADDEMDFTATSAEITILASESSACADLPITDDEVALEGNEVFLVELVTPMGVPSTSPQPSTVTIIDDDVVGVSFIPTLVEVEEDIPGGVTMVCLRGNATSAQAYTVTITHQPSGNNPATAGDDYTVDMADLSVVFPSGEPTTQCIPVGIVDDPISLEERETFMFTITSTTDGVVPGDDPEATVAINDDDEPDFNVPGVRVPENGASTEICIEKPFPTAQSVTLRVEVLNVEDGVDIADTVFVVVIPGDELSQCITIDLIDNKVALEGDRTYPIRITVIEPAGSGITIPDSTLTITENDMLEVYFENENYPVSESVGQVETCLLLNCEAAEPVTVTFSAHENIPADAQDGQDFGAAMATVTFQPGETRACARFDIVDDDVVETPGEEDFTVSIVDTTPDVDTTRQPSTTVTITDDDSVGVRIVPSEYVVVENETVVRICVEKVGMSAEDITVTITSVESSPASAKAGMDFTPSSVDITIPASETMACNFLPITDDDMALEPNETFVVGVLPPPGITTPPPVTVTIIDDDVVGVFFTTPEVSVREDVPSMATEVCFIANATSATPYVVVLGRRETGDNPATATEDYTVAMAALTVAVPAGMPTEMCIDVGIVNDRVAYEGNETFEFHFADLDNGVFATDPSEAEVTIIDDDTEIEVNFITKNVTVNENNGTVFVCLNRSAVTEESLNVPISFTTGSADTNDFVETSLNNVEFKSLENMTCAEVPIVDDVKEEPSENFMVAFSSPMDGLTVGDTPLSVVTILDNDDVSSECSISEPLLVSPFNASTSYNFRGTCELIALRSCDESEEPDFAVRVDFISDTMDNGAVGVYRNGLRWISREDGSFFSDIEADSSSDENVMVYSANDIRVTLNASESTTVIEVGGTIQVTVTHVYDVNTPSVSIGTGSGSTLSETCGICGTQSGQLRSLDGSVATNPTEIAAFVESYRVAAADISLRPVTAQCSTLRNDTVMGDPLFTVPVSVNGNPHDYSLCFEVHGKSNTIFNLISDSCVSVNAHFVAIGELNVIGAIGIRAQDNTGECHNIKVDVDGCALSTGSGDAMTSTNMFSINGISARKSQIQSNRVRISVPNCSGLRLVMWVTCEITPLNMITFRIIRGTDLAPTSHGLLGQFWNVPVTAESFVAPAGSEYDIVGRERLFSVTVDPMNGGAVRSFLGDLFPRSWDNTRENCLYVGNGQGGPGGEFDELPDSVIQGRYTDYIVDSMFGTDFEYDRIGVCTSDV